MNKIYLSIASQRAEVSHVHRGGQHVCTSGSGSSVGGEAPSPVCDEKKQLRGERGSVSIFVKLQVLDYLNSLSASVTAKETLCMLKFPVLLRCQGQLGKPGSFSDSQNRPMPRLCRFALENNSNNLYAESIGVPRIHSIFIYFHSVEIFMRIDTFRKLRLVRGVGCHRWKRAAEKGGWRKLPLTIQKRCKEVPGWSSEPIAHIAASACANDL